MSIRFLPFLFTFIISINLAAQNEPAKLSLRPTASVADTLYLELVAESFPAITAASQGIAYDAEIFTIAGYLPGVLLGLDDSNFNFNDTGNVYCSWFLNSEAVDTLVIEEGAVLYTLLLTINDTIPDGTRIEFDDDFIATEIFDARGDAYPLNTCDYVAGELSTATRNLFKPVATSVFPNPTTEFVNFDLQLINNQPVELSIYSPNGHLVDQKLYHQTPFVWRHSDVLSGSYFYQLRQANFIIGTGQILIK